MIFRRPCIGDMADILAMEDECFPEGIRESEKLYEDRIFIFPEGCLVCQLDGKCVGSIWAEIWRVSTYNEALFKSKDSINERHYWGQGNTIFITSLCVLEKYRRKGIAEILLKTHLDNLLNDYPDAHKLLLIVGEPWKSAQALYIKQGFNFVPNLILKDHFNPKNSAPFNALVMEKR